MTTAADQLDRITRAAALLRSSGPAAAAAVVALGPTDARVALRLGGVVTDPRPGR